MKKTTAVRPRSSWRSQSGSVQLTPGPSCAKLASSFIAAVKKKNLEKILGYYAPEAIVLPPGEPGLHGKEAIRAYWERQLAAGLDVELKVTECYSTDVLAIERGSYKLKPTYEQGRYVRTWRLQSDGKFCITSSVSVSDKPEQLQKPRS